MIRNLILVGVLIVSLGIRLLNIQVDKPPLYIDETMVHYLKWTELTRKEVFFKDLYDAIIYAPATYTWLFGLSTLGVRLPAAIYGTVIVFLIFLLAKASLLNKGTNNFTLIVAFLAGSVPWLYMISRIGHTHIVLMLAFYTFHLILFMRANNLKAYLTSFIPLMISLFYYQSMIVLVPIAALFYCWFLRKMLRLSHVSWIVGLGLILILTIGSRFLYSYQGISILYRATDLAIWRDINTTADSDLSRGLARISEPTAITFWQDPEKINGFFYNYPLSATWVFVRNYLSFYSPDFLFIKGDPVLRHSTGMVGVFFPVLLPFLFYGIYLITTKKSKFSFIFWLWLLISPIPAAVTKDGNGYLLRAVTMLPLLTIASGLGIYSVFAGAKIRFRLILGSLLIFVYIFSTISFLYSYFQVYPALSAKSYEFGFKELSDFQKSQQNKIMLVVWDGYYPHYHFRFWQQTPSKEYLGYKTGEIKFGKSKFNNEFYNLYFSLPNNIDDLSNFSKMNKVEFVAIPYNYVASYYDQQTMELVKVINYPDQSEAFRIFKLTI